MLLLFAPRSMPFNCLTNGVKKFLVPTGLGQELDSSRLHGLHAHWNIAVAGYEYDRHVRSRLRQFTLELESAKPRQSDIEHEAASNVRALTLEERVRRPKELDVKTH